MVDATGEPAATPPGVGTVRKQWSLRAGIEHGLLAGLVMLGCLALCARAIGLGWLHPLEAIGATTGATGGAAITSGAALHAVVSVSFGIPFAAILPRGFPRAPPPSSGVPTASSPRPS